MNASNEHSIASLLAALGLLAGCQGIGAPLPVLDGAGFFDRPWPSDLRRIDGHPDMSGFPKRDDVGLLDTYALFAETLDGFSNNAPVYLRFHGDLDLDTLPDPAASMGDGSPLFLVDVDRDSPHRGERVPIEWAWQDEETEFQASDMLAVRPVYGFPLRPSTQYALVVLEPVARVGDSFAAVWDPDHPDHACFEPLQETLFTLGVDVESVAVATVFTTQDPVTELAEYADYVIHELDLPAFVDPLERIDGFEDYDLYEGWTFAPLFQEGERPYAQQGGALFRNEAGQPRPYTWEWIRFSLAVPRNRAQPEGGWPLYIYSHGTGGDYITYANNGVGLEVARVMARAGFVGIGIDQPLHGVRATDDTDEEFHSFNILNPDSARGNFRQGALDQVWLAAAIAAAPYFSLPGGVVTTIDTDRIVFLGHSQGGIAGAIAGPFLGDHVRAMYLSGAGGGLGQTLLYREAGIDLVAVLEAVLGMDEDERVDTFHPVVGLIQWLSDVTDPINYAPYWFYEQPPWVAFVGGGASGEDGAGLHVAMSEGLLDTYTPYQTTEALAAAGRVPQLDEVVHSSLAHQLRGLDPDPRPASGNTLGYDDVPVTAGLSQYGEDGHFAIFDNTEAAYTYLGFLLSASSEEPPTIQAPDWRLDGANR